jgi:three-Cys-motif partner protein
MRTSHTFGGDWTSDKLNRLQKYLQAYAIIFDKNERARNLHTIYVDAFAGTGYRTPRRLYGETPLLPEFEEPETQRFLAGSARIALEINPTLKEYLFIEQDPNHSQELHILLREFPQLASRTKIISQDANSYLLDWCSHTNWSKTRAVVFLDPYGMQIEWGVIDALGRTQAVDLWLLFPLGVAVNRLLTKTGPPPPSWSMALSRIFGTDDWEEVFYPVQKQHTFWGEEETQVKQGDFEKIGGFFYRGLKRHLLPLPLTPCH